MKTSPLQLADDALLGVGVILFGTVWWVFASMRTGVDGLDRWGIRLRIALYSVLYFQHRAILNDFAIPRALMAICNNETGGSTDAPVLGDQSSSLGPSVGPMQVLRQTAQDLGLWTPPDDGSDPGDAYAAQASDEGWCVKAGVEVFASKLDAAGGDVQEAIRRYNGSGPDAETYQQKAVSWASSLGWSL